MLINPSLSFAGGCCVDADGDGYSDPKTCRSGTDCYDNIASIHPGTPGCNNCKDADDDGYFAYDPVDCYFGNDLDDANPEVNPGKDNDDGCNSLTWYEDFDDDGYSNGTTIPSCKQPSGYKLASELIQTSGDCADDDIGRNPGAEEVCGDGTDNNCDGTEDEGCCEGWVDVSLKDVRPKNTGGDAKTYVFIGLSKPAPPKGCNVSLVVEPEKKSGGHEHDDKRPKGALSTLSGDSLSKDAILFGEGKTDTEPLIYTSSAISGIEKIKANFKESGKSSESEIHVKVAELAPFPAALYAYRLTGNTCELCLKHPDNHYGTSYTNQNAAAMAWDYYERHKISLGINDMSLESGGLFDIKGNWSSSPGHQLHRIGKSVDIDRTGITKYGGGISLSRKPVADACVDNHGRLLKEATFHCEF
ncbi:MAG: putative metal-binding motif-containing protein [Thermodesulfobacteriota bacterium]